MYLSAPGFSSRNASTSCLADFSASSSVVHQLMTLIIPGNRQPTVQIYNCNIRTTDHHSLAHHQSQSTSTTSHNAHSALERERVKRASEVHTSSALYRSTGGELVLLMLVLDGRICAGEGPLVFFIFLRFEERCCAVN